jgi:hypothetical protein
LGDSCFEDIVVINSIALTLVTLAYVVLTYRMSGSAERSSESARVAAEAARKSVDELESQREAAMLPFVGIERLAAAWYGRGLTSVTADLRNAGVGSAIGVELTVWHLPRREAQTPAGSARPGIDPIVPVGTAQTAVTVVGVSASNVSNSVDVQICIRYQNVLGRAYSVDEEFSFTPGETVPRRSHPARLSRL